MVICLDCDSKLGGVRVIWAEFWSFGLGVVVWFDCDFDSDSGGIMGVIVCLGGVICLDCDSGNNFGFFFGGPSICLISPFFDTEYLHQAFGFNF